MRVDRVLALIIALALFLLIGSILVYADCGGPLNPCTYCGDGAVQCPNDDGLCEECDGAIGCSPGYTCTSCSCSHTGCNYDGTCQSPPEYPSNCPSDCCASQCSGRECGSDGCGGYCPPYYSDCPGDGICLATGQCCAPSCPSGSSIACGSTYTGSDGCDGSCSVTGSNCPISGEWCFRGSCIECSFPFQCDDQNACTDDSCVGGDCVNAPVPGRSCAPVGGGAGECDASGTCIETCTLPMADCNDDGSCEINTDTDPEHCGSCGAMCSWDQNCDTGNCVCAYNPVSAYCDTQECGAFTVCGTTLDCGECPDCDTNADCGPGESCCDGACIDTQSNPTNCGACGATCVGDTPWCLASSCVACRDDGDCGHGGSCIAGVCVTGCTPDCTGRECGADGCGGSCGLCSGGQTCVDGECSCPDGSVWTGVECEKVVCSDGAIESCYDGPTGTQGVGVCVAGTRECTSNVWGACEHQTLPSTETCNGADDDCDDIVDEGSLCPAGQLCQGGACQASAYFLNVLPANVLVMEGRWFNLDVSIEPETPFALQTNGFDVTISQGPPFTLSGMSDSPGRWTLDLEAHHFGLLAQLSLPIVIHCDPTNECCREGEIYYDTDNRPCTLNNGGPGICTNDGCVENCIDNYELRCHDNGIWYFDSCGHPEALSEYCDGVCSITDGEPTCEPVTTCDNEPYHQCNGNAVEYVNECYVVTIDHVCGADEACEDGACVPLPPCHAHPGTIQCSDACINPMTNRLNCGGCDRACESDEQCIDAACTPIPGCVVICDTNADCHDDELCIHPGDCSKSQCQPINVLEQNQSAILELHELITEGLVTVNASIEEHRFVYRVRNLAGTPLNNVTITAAFSKLIAGRATDLLVNGVDYVIVEDDPVLAFQLPTLDTTAVFTVAAPRVLVDDDLGLVTILNITYADLIERWNVTSHALTIGLNTEFDGENTQFHFTLNPDKKLKGVSVPISIPKCMAEYASAMELAGDYEVIEEDPLIVWRFDELNHQDGFSFGVPGDIDDECKAQLRAMAIANHVGKPLNPWLALFLIPAISVTLIFFQRFTPTTIHHERMKKADYVKIAKTQDLNDEEIQRSWKDYKRRF